MSRGDIIALFFLVISFGLTWFLFFRSLKVVDLIYKKNLKHLKQIEKRLKPHKKALRHIGKIDEIPD